MKRRTDFHYRVVGDAATPALVFLHGFLGDLREWDAVIAACARDYRCLAVDLPGHGKTSTSAFGEEDDLSTVARALLNLLDALGVKRCSLIGYSMGGRLALQMAILDPARFAGLVLESASPGLRDDGERQHRCADDYQLAARLAEANLGEFLKAWYAQPMFGDMRRDAQRFDALMKQRLDNNPKELARALRLMSVGRQPSLRDAWRENRIPALLLAGERDAKYVGIATEMVRACPVAEMRVLDGCGHNTHYDDPDAYARAVKDSLMKLLFSTRKDFRNWLSGNAETSEGVWLMFGKTKAVVTLTANEALEEALCFGWIDGQMKSIDDTKYVKYFARRREKSMWSDKNKKTVQTLRENGLVTELGERAIALAIKHGTWDAQKRQPITDEQIEALAKRLHDISPAYENFMKMSPSVRRTYAGAYFAPKSDEARQRGFDRIVDRLNKNLKPM